MNWKRLIIYISTLAVAFAILFASILRTASVRYEVNENYRSENIAEAVDGIFIDYHLVYPGRVLPDSPIWFLKALRDRVWLFITADKERKAEIKLLLADKRIGSAKILIQEGKFEKGLSTMTKAEKYLEEASYDEETLRRKGIETKEFLDRLTRASLMHYQVMQCVLEISPEELKPIIIENQSYAKKVFEKGKNGLLDQAAEPPKNPFNWQ